MARWFTKDRSFWILAAVLFGAIVVGACVTVARRANDGRGAFVRFMRQTDGLYRGETIYHPSEDPTGLDEGYPSLPMMALILKPFQMLGPAPGAALWALFKGLLVAVVALGVFRFPKGFGPPFPAWTAPVLVLLSAQVVQLDLTHSNTNLLIAALVAGALLATRAKRDVWAGLLIGLGAVLKVTPLLFLAYFVWKRRWKAVLGVGVGLVFFALVVPGLVLGFGDNLEQIEGWSEQMLAPFLSGEGVHYTQTGYMNQSLTGFFQRLLTDSIAVWPQPAKGVDEVRVNVLSLDSGVVAWIVRIASLGVLALLAWACRTPRDDRRHMGNLGEFALVSLGMLLLSERSWRPHYGLIGLAHAFLLYDVTVGGATGVRRRVGITALVVSLLTHHGAFDELFGKRIALLFECYGVFLFGALVLFAATTAVLRAMRKDGFPVPSIPDRA